MLEEVVVTAQKKEENLQDTPIAITAITESTIDDLDLANIVDLANLAPNVHIINTPSNNTAATIAMRGGVTINPAITWEPTVGMYLDGVYLGKGQGSIFDVVDLERVEILRGPQGTLYGRNTLGGAINLISKKPSGAGTSSKLTVGNYGLKQAQLIGDYSLGENVYTKLVLNKKKRGGYVNVEGSPYQAAQGVVPNTVTNHLELDSVDSKGMKFSVLFEGDVSSLNLTIDRTEQNNVPPFAQLTNTIPNWSTAFGVGASPLTGGLKLWPIELFNNETLLKDKKITSEVCIHHLSFNDKDYEKKKGFIKWNPSVKTSEDQKQLWESLLEDRIDVIATDHAPHTFDEKSNNYLNCPSGGPMVQHSLSVMFEHFLNNKILDKIASNTMVGGATLTKILGTSAWYAPGSSIAYLVDSILNDKRQTIPCSVLLNGEYNHKDICIGVPCVIGKNGVEEIVELDLNDDEMAKFNSSAIAVKSMNSTLTDHT